MRHFMRSMLIYKRRGMLGILVCVAAAGAVNCELGTNAAERSEVDPLAVGQELFLREWLPGDSRSRGGDGLGPVFNDSSCVACHNQGGTGGAGPASKNVDIISAFANPQQSSDQSPGLMELVIGGIFGFRQPAMRQAPKQAEAKPDPKAAQKELRDEMTRIHPGFRTSRSVVLHRAGTQPEYAAWKAKMEQGNVAFHGMGVDFEINANAAEVQTEAAEVAEVPFGAPVVVDASEADQDQFAMHHLISDGGGIQFNVQIGNFLLAGSQRNTPALFGAGLINTIPDKVLEEAANRRFPEFPKVTGRVARLKDGKIGRFGWKSQKASLREFVMTACAVELGLNVPEHAQSGLPHDPQYKAPGLDLNEAECNALVSFVERLPAPVQSRPVSSREARYVDEGKTLFTKVGCATCHAERLGLVAGIYSDLALHDLGPQLADSGSYGVFLPDSADEECEEPVVAFAQTQAAPRKELTPAEQAEEEKKLIGAKRQEWRTPPLWGVRDSSPYLHDGRAQTLEEAIAHHGGEAKESRRRFLKLTAPERLQLVSFLKSLTAPERLAQR